MRSSASPWADGLSTCPTRSSEYVFNPCSDSIQEMEVRRLEVIDGDLYVFMTCDGDMNDYSRDEAMEYMAKESYIPGWFVIDEGFYGLQLPTLISIAEALKRN